jgi:hypothetical protein
MERFVFRQGYKLLLAAKVEEGGIVANAVAAVAVRHLVLVNEDLVGAVERFGHDETAAAVVERRDAEGWKEDGGGGFLFDGLERKGSGNGGAESAADVGEGGRIDVRGGVAGGVAGGLRRSEMSGALGAVGCGLGLCF